LVDEGICRWALGVDALGELLEVEKVAMGGAFCTGVEPGAPESGDGMLIELRRGPSLAS
jgi:hypothetical protein